MTDTENTPPDPLDDDQLDEQAPPAVDLLDVLTIGELDAGSRKLGASLVRSITQQSERYEAALAVVLWLHRRRRDRSTSPDLLWSQLKALTFVELSEQSVELARELAGEKAEAGDPLVSRPG